MCMYCRCEIQQYRNLSILPLVNVDSDSDSHALYLSTKGTLVEPKKFQRYKIY